MSRLEAQVDISKSGAAEVLMQVSSLVISPMAWGVIAFSFLSLLIWLLFSNRIFGPIVPIRRQIERLTKGDYEFRIQLRRHDELKEVADDLNRLAEVLKNSRGQSLVQVLVSVGIMGILIAAMASMQENQTRENRALSEKLAANDLVRAATSTLSGTACNLLFTAPGNVIGGNLTIPSTVSPNNPFVINLQSIPTSLGPPITTIATIGQPPSPLSNTLIVLPAAGIQLSVTDVSTANLLVNFDQTKLVRTIHNLSFPLNLSVDSANKIVSCSTTAMGSANLTLCDGSNRSPCGPGVKLIGCWQSGETVCRGRPGGGGGADTCSAPHVCLCEGSCRTPDL